MKNIDDSPIVIYINKIENRIIFRQKSGYSPALFNPETTKLFENTEAKIICKKDAKIYVH